MNKMANFSRNLRNFFWHRQYISDPMMSDWKKRIIVVVTSLLAVSIIYLIGLVFIQLDGINEGLFTESLGILFTVLLIDGLAKVAANIETRESLIRRAASTSNETAKSAIDELRKIGWIDAGYLRGVDLTGANLRGAMLKKCDLTGIILRNAKLTGANLEKATLTDAVLEKASLRKARMQEAILDGTNLAETDFSFAILNGVKFKRDETDTNGPEHINRAVFRRASLIGTDLSNLKTLTTSKFMGADLSNAAFNNCDLTSTNFEKATLTGTKFIDATLSKASFKYAEGTETKFQRAVLQEAKLLSSEFRRSNFSEAVLRGSFITRNTVFWRSKFTDNADLNDMKIEDLLDGEEPIKGHPFEYVEFDRTSTLPDGKKWSIETFEKYLQEKFDMSDPADEYENYKDFE